ncbi:MAG: sulfite exporter TauE/SafE family protein [Rhizobacter sp.]
MTAVYGIVALGAVVAGFVQGLSGFAFGMVAMSFWAWVLEPRLAAVLVVFGSLAGQVLAAVGDRRRFDARLLAPFLLGGLAGIPLGVLLLPKVDMVWFKAGLGTVLVVWCPAMLMARRLPKVGLGSRWADGAVGLAGGVMGGLGGFTGIATTLWCTLRGVDKDTQRAVVQNFNLSMLAVTMGTYLATGLVHREMLPMLGIVGAALLVPVLLGARTYRGLSEQAFRQIVLGLLTVSGVALLVSAVPQVVGRVG